MATCLVFMLLFFAGTAPDVMKEDGDNWIKLPLAQSAEMTSDHAPH
jgi:hypothetical protein